jgi:hypothetical protein
VVISKIFDNQFEARWICLPGFFCGVGSGAAAFSVWLSQDEKKKQ